MLLYNLKVALKKLLDLKCKNDFLNIGNRKANIKSNGNTTSFDLSKPAE